MKPTRWLLLPLLLAAANASAELSAERLQRYQTDLDVLAAELPKRHANLFHTTSKADFEREVAVLRARLPELDDAEALVGLARISTLARDGHTALFLLPFPGGPGVPGIRQLPIQFHAFDDGLRVIAADRAHADLLGATLTGVGDLPVDELRRRIVELVPQDNAMGRAEYVAWYAAIPEVLHAVGAAADMDHVALRIAGRRDPVVLAPMSEAPDTGWATRLVTLPGPRERWIGAADNAPTPRWLRDTAKPYWFERDADGLVYAQINLMRDAGPQSFADFAAAVLAQVPNDETAKLVLDLRFNRGGDGDLIWPMIYGLIRHEAVNQPGRLFVITGRRTFSAAQMFANALEQHTKAIFVGEPTGSSPNHYGEVGQIRLPGSGLTVIYSQYFYQHHPADRRPWIPPHLAAPLTYDDLVRGRDPAMAAIAGFTPPPNAVALLQPKLDAGDVAGALRDFTRGTAAWRNPWRNLFEVELNDYGYVLMGKKRLTDAIAVFKLVTELYPESANAWDSLGEAQALAGNRARAAYCYARSLRLNPDNAHGADQLDALLGH
jgi:tetratricopeptide (TPR) repeat protein